MLPEFSEHERMVLKIIGDKKMTVAKVSEIFYHSRQVPLEERNYVGLIIRRISAKCEKLKLSWTIKGQGTGRKGRTVWRGRVFRKTPRGH